jgi:hypothetical protein
MEINYHELESIVNNESFLLLLIIHFIGIERFIFRIISSIDLNGEQR